MLVIFLIGSGKNRRKFARHWWNDEDRIASVFVI